jgi:hypothetical protein
VLRLNERALVLLLLLGLGAGLVAHCSYYWPFLSDDALISLRYAERLAQGHGLTWTAGEKVEGYSDLLWVLITGLFGLARFDLVTVARCLDFVGVCAVIVVVGLSPRARRLSLPRIVTAGTFLVLSAPLAVWAIGGLEHGFMAGLLAVGLLALFRISQQARPAARQLARVGLLFALLALARVDGVVLVVGTLLGLLFAAGAWRERVRRIVWLATPAAIALVGQELFRALYYGQRVPNTALVKVAFTPQRLLLGLEHIRDGYSSLWALVGLAVAGAAIAVRSERRELVAVPGTLVVTWTAYVALVGGDIFPGWRQLLFVLIPLGFLVAEGAEEFHARWGKVSIWGVVLLIPLAALHGVRQANDPENRRAKGERWEWDGYAIGNTLRRAFASRAPLLAVDAAGALPYWSGLPALDMLGLNDAYLPRHPPPGFGERHIGHDLGDGAYVMRRSPDLIGFNNAAGSREPMFVGGKQMLARPDFNVRYQLVRVQGQRGNRAVGEIYFKREGGPIGIQKTDDTWTIPAYVLDADAAVSPVHLDADDRLVVNVVERAPLELHPIAIPDGVWTVMTDPPSAELIIGLRCPSGSALRQAPGTETSIALDAATPLSFVIGLARPDSAPVTLVGVTLRRASSGVATYRCQEPQNVALRASSADLSPTGRENADWRAPRNVVFGWPGIVIALPGLAHPKGIELSVDNNDTYVVNGQRSGKVIWQTEILPRQNGGGMAVHRLEVPNAVRLSGLDSLELRATAGDGRFSLGHLRLD